MSALPGPGWYADPHGSGSVRWWDGTRWTDNTRPHASVSAPLSVPSPAPVRAPGYGQQFAQGYDPMQHRRSKLPLVGIIIGPVLVLVAVGLIALGSHIPVIAEKSATARVVDAPALCLESDCSYTVVFTDASGVRVTASLSAPSSMNLGVGSTTTINYEVAKPTEVSVPSQSFANDTGNHVIATGMICLVAGLAVTAVCVALMFQARSEARRRVATRLSPGSPRPGG